VRWDFEYEFMVFMGISTDPRECNLRNHVNRESRTRLGYHAGLQWPNYAS